MSPSHPTDPAAAAAALDRALLLRVLIELRVAFADADAVTSDLLRPPRERELGHVQQVRLYFEAQKKIEDCIAWLLRALGGEPPDERH